MRGRGRERERERTVSFKVCRLVGAHHDEIGVQKGGKRDQEEESCEGGGGSFKKGGQMDVLCFFSQRTHDQQRDQKVAIEHAVRQIRQQGPKEVEDASHGIKGPELRVREEKCVCVCVFVSARDAK